MPLSEEYYINELPDSAWLRGNISGVFGDIITTIGALRGVAVVIAEDRSCFEEAAAFGYRNGSFFYDFMTRGQGNFEKLEYEKKRLSFGNADFNLSESDAAIALVFRIYSKGNVLGFLLFEFADAPGHLVESFLYLLSSRFAESLSQTGDTGAFEVIQYLLQSSPSLRASFEKVVQQKPVLISGPSGSGKKTMAKFIHARVVGSGRILVLSTYPEQAGKLEKLLIAWSEMAAGGVVVFDQLHELAQGQQKIFYDFIKSDPGFTAVFIDSLEKKQIYSPLWEMLEERKLIMPSLDSLDKTVLEGVIQRFFDELLVLSQRRGLSLGKSGLNKLKFNTYPGNFNELKNVMENAIQSATGRILEESDIHIGADIPMGTPETEDLDLRRCVESLERQKIMLASRLFSGNQLRMAKALGISRGSLQYKMRQMGLG